MHPMSRVLRFVVIGRSALDRRQLAVAGDHELAVRKAIASAAKIICERLAWSACGMLRSRAWKCHRTRTPELPPGTFLNSALAVEDRMSWYSYMLNVLNDGVPNADESTKQKHRKPAGLGDVVANFDPFGKWDSPRNAKIADYRLAVAICPAALAIWCGATVAFELHRERRARSRYAEAFDRGSGKESRGVSLR